MSGMSSMLYIVLYREASSHHEPKEKGGTAARDATIPKSCSPFQSSRCARSRGWHGGMPSMLLISLMRSTPPFWMSELKYASTPYREPNGRERPLAMPRSTDR
jgi:hypothetical protein